MPSIVDRKSTRPRLLAGEDAPRVEGERFVSRLRFLFAALVLLFVGAFAVAGSADLQGPLVVAAGAALLWASASALVLHRISRRRFHPAIAVASTVADLAFVTALQWTICTQLPLQFMIGPVTTLYFLVIGLAALRRSRLLTLLASAAAGLAHLGIATLGAILYLPGGRLNAAPDGFDIGLNYLDELVKALCMVVFGAVIGYVARSLRQSEHQYRGLFEHGPDGLVIVREDERVIEVSQRFADLVGSPRDQILGRRWEELFEGAPGSPAEIPRSGSHTPAYLTRATGAAVPVRLAADAIRFRGGDCIEVSVRDVAQQVKLEQQLAQSQKMETVGRLAGGLAHDFNNLLGGIIGAASLGERATKRIGDSEIRAWLGGRIEHIRSRGERARDVVGRLLSFSRRSTFEPAPVDLREVVHDAASICRNTFGEPVAVELHAPASQAIVDGEASAITQAVLNLCVNAGDAMPDGGTLTLRLAEVVPGGDADAPPAIADPEQDYWKIEIGDTGVGMDEATRERIFDPFFTTKPTGEGTGLGLSMVFSIAQQHGGFVDVESNPGAGSTFRLYLARSRVSVLPDMPDDELPRGAGTILVVDDDELVRSTVAGMLAELGYEVVQAASGEEALRLFDAREGAFDLLLVDLVMPDLDGAETLARLRAAERAEHGPTPALLMTGFWSEAVALDLEELGAAGVLRKPFTISALAARVADLLAKVER